MSDTCPNGETRKGRAGQANDTVIPEVEVVDEVDKWGGDAKVADSVMKKVVAQTGEGRSEVEEDRRRMFVL